MATVKIGTLVTLEEKVADVEDEWKWLFQVTKKYTRPTQSTV